MEEFFCQCWEDGSKPTVTQGRRYLNHILTKHGRPPLNKHHRQQYASVMDVYKGLEREDEWRNYNGQGAKPLSKDNVKKLLLANIRGADGNINVRKLRNKALSSALILCGWNIRLLTPSKFPKNNSINSVKNKTLTSKKKV